MPDNPDLRLGSELYKWYSCSYYNTRSPITGRMSYSKLQCTYGVRWAWLVINSFAYREFMQFCRSSHNAPPVPIPPNFGAIFTPQANHAKLCGSYNWVTIGNGYSANFSTIGFTLVNGRGVLLSLSYGTPCIQFSKSDVYTTAQADKAWNDTWNYAVDRLVQDVNSGQTALGDFVLRANMTKYIKQYLTQWHYGWSFNPEGCNNVRYSRPQYCY